MKRLTKYEMLCEISGATSEVEKAEALTRAAHLNREIVESMYKRHIEKQNRKTPLNRDKFSALEAVLLFGKSRVWIQVDNTNAAPLQFCVKWSGGTDNTKGVTEFMDDLRQKQYIANKLNDLHIYLTDEEADGGKSYEVLQAEYRQLIEHSYWIDIDGGKYFTMI